MSSPDIVGILENTKELDRLRKDQEEVLVEINKMHKKLQACKCFYLNLISQNNFSNLFFCSNKFVMI